MTHITPLSDNAWDTCVCPEGFTLCGGSCWRYENSSLISYDAAVSLCADLGAEVALTTSSTENDCAVCLGGSIGIWLGLRGSTTLESFLTSDGSTPTYTNWHPTQTALSGCESYGCDNCVYVDPIDGQWTDYRCDFILLVLCQTRTCCA
ncbi:Pulmonary surfactant-associated protein A [Amphibalanus amphitrite]|uniref:Pulmonary surfactant-associated protein A n=1 Tax=Amphibalanus amphitrite TaxID=1232801 RepID=A0A6A4W0V2_AMPAM|nr:Pulmonary surfactant-associated protein A [Amphibalanus amphitrite]